VFYERESKLLKIISINPEAVVFKKDVRARSLKYSFYKTAEEDLNLALTNFQQDVFEMTNNYFTPDFYITASFESLIKLAGKNKILKDLISNKSFANRDLQCLNQLEFAQEVLHILKTRMFSNISSLRKNYDLLGTDITKLAFINMIMYFKINEPEIMFFDLPVKRTKTRVEPDKKNISDTFFIYYIPADAETTTLDGFINVENASGKPRMAEKATWELRENKFDVLVWGNYNTSYEKTIIKDYKGNYGASKKIARVLGSGKVINSFDYENSLAVSVYIGKDCEIYDKLDKKEAVNGAN
jgi:hypothetical protein